MQNIPIIVIAIMALALFLFNIFVAINIGVSDKGTTENMHKTLAIAALFLIAAAIAFK